MKHPLVREPIGLRVLPRAIRPEDDESLLLWRADFVREAEALVEAGATVHKARLWAALLRWSEADAVCAELMLQRWTVRHLPVRMLVLDRVALQLQPPVQGQGWPLVVAGIPLIAVPEDLEPPADDLRRLLSFLDEAD